MIHYYNGPVKHILPIGDILIPRQHKQKLGTWYFDLFTNGRLTKSFTVKITPSNCNTIVRIIDQLQTPRSA